MKIYFGLKLITIIEFFPEECCETCHETQHTHMICPACGDKYAGTDCYGDIFDLELGDTVKCQECKAEFVLIARTDLFKYETYCWRRI